MNRGEEAFEILTEAFPGRTIMLAISDEDTCHVAMAGDDPSLGGLIVKLFVDFVKASPRDKWDDRASALISAIQMAYAMVRSGLIDFLTEDDDESDDPIEEALGESFGSDSGILQ